MSLTVNGKTIATDEEGYLLNPDDWDEDVAKALVCAYEEEGNPKITAEGWALIQYFRDYYEDHQVHPTMHKMLRERAKKEGKDFHEEEAFRDYLYQLFPKGPVPTLCKLAGLPNPKEEIET